jgi:hypothetical protein
LLQLRLGLRNLLQTARAPRQLFRQLVAALALAIVCILGRVNIFGLLQQRFNLRLQPLLGLSHPRIAHRLVLTRVGLDRGSIDGHVPQLHLPRLLAQRQGLVNSPANASR